MRAGPPPSRNRPPAPKFPPPCGPCLAIEAGLFPSPGLCFPLPYPRACALSPGPTGALSPGLPVCLIPGPGPGPVPSSYPSPRACTPSSYGYSYIVPSQGLCLILRPVPYPRACALSQGLCLSIIPGPVPYPRACASSPRPAAPISILLLQWPVYPTNWPFPPYRTYLKAMCTL
jgi:hypothetical protein